MKIDPDAMQSSAAAASELLKALANPHRLMIICQLIERERSVGELAQFLGLRQANVSQHLALLRRDGLIEARRDGQTLWYSVSSSPARKLVSTIHAVYCSKERSSPNRRRASEIKR